MKGPFFRISEMLNGDIPMIDAHVHTELTDGKGSIDDYINKAKELKLNSLAFTEHADDNSTYYEKYIAKKDYYKEMAFPLDLHFGIEVKAAHTDGTINISTDKAEMADFVVGVLHRYPDGNGGYHTFKGMDANWAMDYDYELSKELIKNPVVDVFGHPAGVYSNFFGEYDTDMLRDLVTRAAENNKVVELNSAERYRHAFPIIFQRCVELDCLVSIGSDAHTTDKLGHVVTHLRQYLNK